jgi:hypothetical protein
MGDLDSSVSDEAAPAESTMSRNIRLGMDPNYSTSSYDYSSYNNDYISQTVSYDDTDTDTDTISASNIMPESSLRKNIHNKQTNGSNAASASTTAAPVSTSTSTTQTQQQSQQQQQQTQQQLLLFQQTMQTSLARQEERMEQLFHLCSDTNFKLDLMMRKTDALTGHVRQLDAKVERIVQTQNRTVPVPESVSATRATAKASSVAKASSTANASSQQQQPLLPLSMPPVVSDGNGTSPRSTFTSRSSSTPSGRSGSSSTLWTLKPNLEQKQPSADTANNSNSNKTQTYLLNNPISLGINGKSIGIGIGNSGDQQVTKEPVVTVTQPQQPTAVVPVPAQIPGPVNKSSNSSNNSTKSLKLEPTLNVTDNSNINGSSSSGEKQKRLQQNPQDSSPTAARTASITASIFSTPASTATAITGSSAVPQQQQQECQEEADNDPSNSSDEVMEVSLWEDEEQDLVEIHLPTIPASSSTNASGNDNDDTPTTTTAITSRSSSILKLRQYGSADDRWGIHSTIWDGGLALTAFLASHYYSYYTSTGGTGKGITNNKNNKNNNGKDHGGAITLIDLGSGTGLVGLAVAALSRGHAVVAVTDLARALPLLEENVRLNSKLWTASASASMNTETKPMPVHAPVVHELTWGEPIADAWLEQLLSGMPHNAAPATPLSPHSHSHSRILLTGADIIYRPSLFQPLLSTLSELSARLHQLAPDALVECLLACQSRFSYLQDFWDAARRQNFAVDILAVVRLSSVQKTDLSQATIEYVGPSNSTQQSSKKMTVPPSPKKNNDDDRVYIVRIHKLPYTFSI